MRSLAVAPAGAPGPEKLIDPTVRSVGPYEILDEIARGGMGVVFRARERNLGREVALKLVRGGEWAPGELLERFRTEARAAASLQHPNIVPVYGFGEDEGNWYIAMRLIPGGSLARWRQGRPGGEKSRQPEREAAGVLLKLAEAVHYAHQRGILHRDLKPENVLLDDAGEPFLTDFGLARLTEVDLQLTRTHASLGTPAYMAPEVARGGSSEATVQSDVYGLGAILYELLTGRTPFAGATPLEVLRQVTDTEVRRPSTWLRALDRDLETICLKAIAKEPRERYPDAGALAADLRRWLAGEPIEARAAGPGERVVKWVRRRPLVSSLLAMLLLAVVVITAGSLQVSRNLRAVGERQRQSLVQFHVETANRRAEERQTAGALRAALEALELDSADPERERMHRVRLGLTLREMPTLDRHWRHGAPVTTVMFDAAGRRLLTASLDGTACLWDVDRPDALLTLRHPAPVHHAFLSPDGRSIVTQCADGRAWCWDVESGRERFAPWPVYVPPMALTLSGADQFSPDSSGFVSVVEDRAEIRSLSTGLLTRPPLVQPGPLVHAAFSRDGRRLVTTTAEGLVCAWALEPDGRFRLLGSQQHTGGGNVAAFSPEGDRVLSLGVEPEARLWDAVTGRLLADPLSHSTQVRMGQARFSPDGSRIFTASNDNSVRIWNGTNGSLLIRGIGHSRQINAARWDPAGGRIATASFDGTVSLWDVATGRPLGPVLRQDGYAVDAAFSPSGDRLATISQGGGVRLWTIRPRPVGILRGPDDLIASASFNGDGMLIGVASGNQDFEVRNALSGELLYRLHHPAPAYLGEFDPGGRLLATASKGGRMHVWDLADGREVRVSEPDGLERWWIKFDPKGGRFLSSDERRTQNPTFSLRLWSVADLSATRLPLSLPTEARSPEFSPDGSRLLIEAGKGRLVLWDFATGQMQGSPLVDEGRPFARGQFSPGGDWLITYQADRSLIPKPARLWNARTLSPVGAALMAPDSFLISDFTADGRRVATGGQDSAARIWSVPEGQPLVPPMPHESMVLGVRFSRDGRFLATSTRLGSVRLWDARTGEPLSASYTVTGGVVAMAFVRGDGPLVVVGGDASLHRWDLTPAGEPASVLDSLARELDGEVLLGSERPTGR